MYLADPDTDLYECITHSHNLGGDLLEILREGTIRLLRRQQQESTLAEDTTAAAESIPVLASILATIRVPSSQLPDSSDNSLQHNKIPMGLKEDYLVLRVQSIPKYKHVKRTMILQSLTQLIADSLVFESGYRQYRWMECP